MLLEAGQNRTGRFLYIVTFCLPMLCPVTRKAHHALDMDHHMMRHALVQARIGYHLGEVPVGAGVAFCSHLPCPVSTAPQLPTYMQSWLSETKSSAVRTIVWKSDMIRRHMPRCCAYNRPLPPLARLSPLARIASSPSAYCIKLTCICVYSFTCRVGLFRGEETGSIGQFLHSM